MNHYTNDAALAKAIDMLEQCARRLRDSKEIIKSEMGDSVDPEDYENEDEFIKEVEDLAKELTKHSEEEMHVFHLAEEYRPLVSAALQEHSIAGLKEADRLMHLLPTETNTQIQDVFLTLRGLSRSINPIYDYKPRYPRKKP